MTLEAQAPGQSPNPDDEHRDDFGDDDLYDDEGVQEPAKDAPADGDVDDDYAKTFDVDSPGVEESGIGNNADVSTKPHESMTSSSDASHTLPAAAPVAIAASPLQPAASNSITQPPSAAPAAPPAATPPIQSPAAASMTTTLSAPAPTPAEPVNIDKILENMSRATQNAAPDSAQDSQRQPSPVSVSPTAYMPNVVPATSLPARPPVFDLPAHVQPSPGEFHYPHQSANGPPGHSSNHVTAGPPGVGPDMRQHLPPPPVSQYYPNPHMAAPPASPHGPPGVVSNEDVSRLFEQYLEDERRYTADGKWTDRFPSGSRVFVGNVSQNKVSKREVFDLFYTCGRIAQISLKNSYGFVQFHTAAEGSAAVRNLRGAKIGGQTINVEVSKPQGKDSNRQRSPDRRGRSGNQNHQSRQRDRGYNNTRGRNDYRSPSPRRDYQRHSDGYGRDRSYYDSDRGPRGRSRSPQRDRANYRERSPGYSGVHGGHGSHSGHSSVIPPRYGPDVPDVQIFQTEDLPPAFVDWVCSGFGQSQLRVDVKRLYGQNPYDRDIESQLVSQGVRAVVTLTQATERAQAIPVRVFIRGPQSVNYEDYANLPPHVAARIVQEKTQAPYQQNQYPQYPPQPPPSHGYPQQPTYPNGPPQQQAPPPSGPPPQLAGIDPATLQQIIASMQPSGTSGTTQYGSQAPTNNTNPDLARILATLNSSAAAANSNLPPQQGAVQYGNWSQQGGSNAGGPTRENPSSQVESIMANLARFRQ